MNYSYPTRKHKKYQSQSFMMSILFSLTVKRASNPNAPAVEANEKSVEHLEEKKPSPQKRGGKNSQNR